MRPGTAWIRLQLVSFTQLIRPIGIVVKSLAEFISQLLSAWEGFCRSSSVLRFIDINLRGAGQVMFQNNPLSGLLFLLALCWGAFVAGMIHVAVGGVLALVSASCAGWWFRADQSALRSGLLGYNGVLTGLALTYFLSPGAATFLYATFGGAVTALLMLGPVNADKPWRVAAHTYAFILTTWIFLLASQGFHAIPGVETMPEQVKFPAVDAPLPAARGLREFLVALLNSISQIYFKADALSALLIVAGLAVSSIAAAAFALLGAFIAVLTAHAFGVESLLISSGIQGFSPVLVAIAFGTVFYPRRTVRIWLLAGIATIVAVVAQSALHTLLDPLALPALSAPFDLVAWMLFLNGEHFDPPGSTASA